MPKRHDLGRNLRTALLLALLGLAAGPLSGQATERDLSLRDCLAYALENASAVRQAALEAQASSLELDIERKKALPSIGLSSRLMYHFARPVDIAPGSLLGDTEGDTPIRFGKAIEGGIGLEGRYPIYDRSLLAGRDAPAYLDQVSELRQDLSREETALEVAKTYLQALLVQEKAALLLANRDRIDQLLELTRRQVANGFAKPSNVDRLEVARQNIEVNQRNLELRRAQLLQLLKYQMELPFDTEIELTDSVRAVDLPDLDTLGAWAPERRTAVQLLELRGRLEEIKIDRIAAGASPVLSLWGGLDLVAWGDNPAQWFSTDYWYGASFVGLRLDYPLLGGPLRRAQLERARIEQALGAEQLAQTRRGLQLQHDAALTTLRVKRNDLESLARNRDLAEQLYQLTSREYREGATPVMDLLSAELAAREAQANYLSALVEIRMAHLEWLHANGQLLAHFNFPN